INFLAALYGWALYFFGLKKVHELDTGKALIVMAISGVVWFTIMMLGACGAVVTMVLSRLH
ncbi:MAG: hypothetical protein HY711_08210, partial [Candidatus Melainabacteria bacterium]|nr:hypothetical protein [Candidatus Melainabacteria bacterium]